MNYKERYNAALERARELSKTITGANYEYIFPELKENEDERIKQEILHYIKSYAKLREEKIPTEWFEYMEKQCEQPTDKIEPKFNIGDWVVLPLGIIAHIDSLNSTDYQVTTTDGKICDFKIAKQDNYHLWSINDARDGDVLVTSTGQPFIFSGKYDDIHYGNPIAYCGVNWENKFKIGNGTHWTNKNEVAPATKEQRDLLFQKMKEAGYEWDADKKELKKMEVASKESEDEKIRKDIIAFLLSKNRYMTPNEDWDFHNKWLVWLEKQREKLDPDKVIGWLIANIIDFEYYVNLFRKDFGL